MQRLETTLNYYLKRVAMSKTINIFAPDSDKSELNPIYN